MNTCERVFNYRTNTKLQGPTNRYGNIRGKCDLSRSVAYRDWAVLENAVSYNKKLLRDFDLF